MGAVPSQQAQSSNESNKVQMNVQKPGDKSLWGLPGWIPIIGDDDRRNPGVEAPNPHNFDEPAPVRNPSVNPNPMGGTGDTVPISIPKTSNPGIPGLPAENYDLTPPPKPPGETPLPQLIDPTPQETAAQKLKRLSKLRLGLASTIKTTPQGLPSPLVPTPGLYSPGTKSKLGQ